MITLSLILAAGIVGAQPTGDELGSITGKVVWEGERPAAKPDIAMDDKATVGCVHDKLHKQDESLMIDASGGVANVVLTIEVAGAEKKVPTDPIELDQAGCHFEPHVVVMPVGATLRFANSDEASHNIHIYPKKNQAFNSNVAPSGNLDKVFDKAEVIEVKCDIHTWMKGYAVVTDATHWATTKADGSFEIKGLPPGEYEVSWWHEELGKGKTEKVKVEAGKATTLEHKVGAEKKAAGGRRK